MQCDGLGLQPPGLQAETSGAVTALAARAAETQPSTGQPEQQKLAPPIPGGQEAEQVPAGQFLLSSSLGRVDATSLGPHMVTSVHVCVLIFV